LNFELIKIKEIPWVDVDIEKINTDLVDFQNKCKKLPKGLKDYLA
jgi:dynein heavy chain